MIDAAQRAARWIGAVVLALFSPRGDKSGAADTTELTGFEMLANRKRPAADGTDPSYHPEPAAPSPKRPQKCTNADVPPTMRLMEETLVKSLPEHYVRTTTSAERTLHARLVLQHKARPATAAPTPWNRTCVLTSPPPEGLPNPASAARTPRAARPACAGE